MIVRRLKLFSFDVSQRYKVEKLNISHIAPMDFVCMCVCVRK